MPMAAVAALKRTTGLPDAELAALIGISLKTLSRARSAGARLDPVTSDRLFRVSKIVALAIEVLEGRQAALSWLTRPQLGLGGQVPLRLLTTEAGTGLVEQLLTRMEHGVYA
jgi:putative toxin-antitoxin system antitoxin component (TIGR02293 family)